MIGAGCAVALLAPIAAIAAEDSQLLATADKPATLTATPAAALEGTAAARRPSRVIVYVTGYQPPQKGAVNFVVKVQKPDGSDQEIGTFTEFPNQAFKGETSRPRKHPFDLPKELATGAVKVKVEVVPLRGSPEGAQLEVGRAETE
jgi:hypothetical protein